MADAKLLRHKVFISYSHNDAAMLARLQVHLKRLERDGLVSRWDDTDIRIGQRWRNEIRQAIATARVAVLLVSPDFLASDFIAKDELPPLLLAAEKEGLVIMCVNLSHYYEHGETLAQFQQANPPSKPLEGMSKVEQDAVLAKLAKEVVAVLHPKVDQPVAGKSARIDKPADQPVKSGLSISELAKTLAPGSVPKKPFDMTLAWASAKKEPGDWNKLLDDIEKSAATAKPAPQPIHPLLDLKGWEFFQPLASLAYTFHSLPDGVQSIAFSPDGRRIATTCWGVVHLWEAPTRRWLAALEGQRVMHDRSRWRYKVSGGIATFAPDSRTLATTGVDQWAKGPDDVILLWDLEAREVYAVLQGHEKSITSLAFSPDGQRLASGSDDATAKIWNLRSQRVEHDLWGHGDDVDCVAYSNTGNLLASGSEDATIKLWSPFTGQEKLTLRGLKHGAGQLAFVPNSSLLAATVLGKLKLWNTQTGQFEGEMDEGLFALAVSADGKLAAVDAGKGEVAIYRLADRALAQRFQAHEERTQCLAFSSDGGWLLSGGVDRTAKLWKITA